MLMRRVSKRICETKSGDVRRNAIWFLFVLMTLCCFVVCVVKLVSVEVRRWRR